MRAPFPQPRFLLDQDAAWFFMKTAAQDPKRIGFFTDEFERQGFQAALVPYIQRHRSKFPEECAGIRAIFDAKRYQGGPAPIRCIRCCLHILQKRDLFYNPQKIEILQIFSEPSLLRFQQHLQEPDGQELLLRCLYEIYPNLLETAQSRALLEIFQTPQRTQESIEKDWRDLSRVSHTQAHRDRLDRFHEELIATAWHPRRFLDWCIDVEEREEVHSLHA